MRIRSKILLINILEFLLIGAFIISGCDGKAPGEQSGQDLEKTYTFKLSNLLPDDHPSGAGALKFAELVKEKTAGKVKIEVYGSAQMGSEKDNADAIALGKLDFAVLSMSDIARRYPVASIFEAPYIFRDREHLIKVYESDLCRQIFDEMVQEINVRVLGPMYYGTRYITTSKVTVRVPEDLKGLKIRSPDQPTFISIIKAMGAKPTPMALAEVYLALQQGVVDGQENPISTIAAMKFDEVQKYLSTTGHVVMGQYIFASERVLEDLPDNYRNAILEAGKEAAEWTTRKAFQAEDYNFREVQKNGIIVVEPDKEAFKRVFEPLHKKYEEEWGMGTIKKIQSIE